MKISSIILWSVLVLMQYPLWFGDGGLFDVFRLKQTVANQQAENAVLAQENAVLAAEVVDLQQGLDAVEERARNELGMVKRSETFYQIIE